MSEGARARGGEGVADRMQCKVEKKLQKVTQLGLIYNLGDPYQSVH